MVNIRKYKDEDLGDVKNLLKENLIFHEEVDTLGMRQYNMGDEDEQQTKLKDRLENHGGYLLLAEDEKRIIGFGFAWINGNKGRISKIYVDEKYRGQGIGTKVLHKLENYLKDQGLKYITLSVYGPNSKAHNIYVKEGYNDRFIEMIKKI